MLKDLSTYDLIYELVHDGKADLYPDREPLLRDSLLEELESRSRMHFGDDVERWISWFLQAPDVGTEAQRESFRTIEKIVRSEKKALNALKRKRDDVGPDSS